MGEKCKVSYFSALGSKSRRSVESIYVTSLPDKSNGTLILLADGFGNHINSNLISKMVCENFISQYASFGNKEPTKESLSEIFQFLHEFVTHKSSFFGSPGLKSALMAILAWSNHLLIANTGNIACFYLLKGIEPEVKLLTKPYAEKPIEEVSALGMEGELDFEILERSIINGDKLFAVTDGISSVMEESEILSFIKKTPNASFPKTIVNRANDLDAEDNSTAIAIEFGISAPVSIAVEPKKPKPQPVKKEKPFKPEKVPVQKKEKHSLVWFLWLILAFLLIFGVWWGYPRIQSWMVSFTAKESTTPITNLPSVVPPVEEPNIQSTMVTFQVNPSTAWIQVFSGKKDTISGTSDRLFESHGESNQLTLAPGTYTVYTQQNGYEVNIQHFELNGEKDYLVTIQLNKIITPPPKTKPPVTPVKPPVAPPKPPIKPVMPPMVKEWTIAVTTQPIGAKIYINNQFTGLFTPATLKFKPGNYLVTVSKAGYKEQSRSMVYTSEPPSFYSIHFVLEKTTAFNPDNVVCHFKASGEAI